MSLKISHSSVKISIALLLILILLSNAIYWHSISTLSEHINSFINVSDHQENGETFHSAVHSMLMNAMEPERREQYFESLRQADEAVRQFQHYLDHAEHAGARERLAEVIDHIGTEYRAFSEFTGKMITYDSALDPEKGRVAQKLFDGIFANYKELFRHHHELRKELLRKTEVIRKSIRLLQVVMATAAIIACLLIILYMDRVALKLYDVTERLALHDRLTGLYNRHGLDRIVAKVERSAARSERGSYGVILMDIDHFKKFNDSYGHPAGDRLLAKLAELLLQTVRDQDKVVRYGGEEILIFLSGTGLAGTREVANKIRRIVAENPFDLLDGSEPKYITVSIGYVAFPHDRGTFQELTRIADKHLYQAKDMGRNMVAGPTPV